MPLTKPQAQPGFQSQATQVQAAGAWYGGNLVRWRGGLLEKWIGWERLFFDAFAATIRRMHAWLDLDNNKNLLVATDLGVQIAIQDTIYELGHQTDIQGGYILELGPSGATTFTVASGSTTITVSTDVPVLSDGSFMLQLAISIGGRILAAHTFFKIKALVAGGFTFDMPQAAVTAETDTYGVRLLTNDVANVMTVTWKAHGLTVGSRVTFAQTTTVRYGAPGAWEQVNFSAPAGTVVTVASVPDADHFTFSMAGLGTGDGAGGVTHQVYEGCSTEHDTSGGFTTSTGAVIGIAIAQLLGNPQKQSWFLANLGQDGLILTTGGPLQVYHPPISNGPFIKPVGSSAPVSAPQANNGMLVAMPQAQVILFGSEPIMGSGVIDPLLVRWSDVGTYDVYNATVSNQAGSFRLSRGSRIVGAVQSPQATLLFTDTDVWMMSYVGPPLIYGFTIMATGCGLVAPHAVGVVGTITIWQSLRNFWQFAGGVQPVPCSVWDYIFEDLDTVNLNKCHAAPNSSTNELMFFFPSRAGAIDQTGNLLLWSTALWEFGAWAPLGATVSFYALFKALYVYEPNIRISGWFDDSAFALISWWDRDLQGQVTTIILAPDGSGAIVNLQETATTGMHQLSQAIVKRQQKVTYTFSVFAHVNSTRNLTLRAGSSISTAGYAYATFDVVHGNVVASGVTSPSLALNQAKVLTDPILATGPGGNGWLRYIMTFTSDSAADLTVFLNVTNDTQLSYTGVPPNGCLIWGAQLVEGSDPGDYQETSGTQIQNEAKHYVKINMAEGGVWDSGVLTRSAWLDNSVWGTPLGADENNLVQQHERGFDADDGPMRDVYAETGFAELADGSNMMMIDEVHPDFKWSGRDGGVKVTLKATNYPEGPQHNFGPYSMTPTTQFFNPRVRARYVALRYDWEPIMGFSARVGAVTYRIKPAGKRP
jgi:hypothetical protein